MSRACARLAIPLSLVVLASACGEEAPEAASSAPVVRDSAGIRIVENHAPSWGEEEAWTVAAEPDLAIAEIAGVPIYRIGSIDVDTSGRMLVTHQSEQEVVILAPDGPLERRFGRRGEGPGEFTRLTGAYWVDGDSVLAVDAAGRVTAFEVDGDGLRTTSVPMDLWAEAALSLLGSLADGRLILDGWRYDPRSEGTYEFGQIVSTSPGLDDPTHLVTMPFSVCAQALGDGCIVETFGPLVTMDVGDSVVAAGFGTAYEVRVETPPPLASSEIWRLVREPVEVTDEMWGAYRGALDDGGKEVLDEVMRDQSRPGSLPHFRALVVAESGGVWVREEERIDSRFFTPAEPDRGPRSWGVFDRNGTFLGRVRTPASFDLHVIADDYVLGVHRDEFDVETIRRYRLSRGGG